MRMNVAAEIAINVRTETGRVLDIGVSTEAARAVVEPEIEVVF
jgi:hypothetical protein